jgi:hypothetical protein
MARTPTLVKAADAEQPSAIACGECGAKLAPLVRRFPTTQRMGVLFCCPKCAAISVIDGPKARGLRTHEWTAIVLLPEGYDLLELRVTTAKKLGLC